MEEVNFDIKHAFAEVEKHLGKISVEKTWFDGEYHRAAYVIKSKQIFAVFDGKNNVAPIRFNELISCELMSIPHPEDKVVTETTHGNALLNASVGAMFGTFFFTTERKKHIETDWSQNYTVWVKTSNPKIPDFPIYIGEDRDVAKEICVIIESIINQPKKEITDNGEGIADPDSTQVCVHLNDYPDSIWKKFPTEYYVEALSNDYVFIPKSIIEEVNKGNL